MRTKSVGSSRARAHKPRKDQLAIDTLTRFRDALVRESELIETSKAANDNAAAVRCVTRLLPRLKIPLKTSLTMTWIWSD